MNGWNWRDTTLLTLASIICFWSILRWQKKQAQKFAGKIFARGNSIESFALTSPKSILYPLDDVC
jgi:hypothetical protein